MIIHETWRFHGTNEYVPNIFKLKCYYDSMHENCDFKLKLNRIIFKQKSHQKNTNDFLTTTTEIVSSSSSNENIRQEQQKSHTTSKNEEKSLIMADFVEIPRQKKSINLIIFLHICHKIIFPNLCPGKIKNWMFWVSKRYILKKKKYSQILTYIQKMHNVIVGGSETFEMYVFF